MRNADEGLGLSLLIYAGAIIGVLALVAGPIVWANSPTVYENATLHARAADAPGGPLGRRDRNEFPVALLKHPAIVDAATLAKVEEAAQTPAKPVRTAARPAKHRRYAQAPEADAPPEARPQRRGFFFSLF
jgi:hypothetical protein